MPLGKDYCPSQGRAWYSEVGKAERADPTQHTLIPRKPGRSGLAHVVRPSPGYGASALGGGGRVTPGVPWPNLGSTWQQAFSPCL